MRYLKSDLFDESQQPMIIYRLIEFEQIPNWTIEKNILILCESKTGTREISRKESDDFEDKWSEILLTQKFVESSENEFLKDTDGIDIIDIDNHESE